MIATRLTVCALLLAPACGGDAPGASGPGVAVSQTETGDPQRFDDLTIELRLESTEVEAGGQIESEVLIRNDSDRPVTDPGCLLYAPRFALVPEDDPDAELWGAIVVDCSGPATMHPGEDERASGPTFRAADKYGEPLPPGDYLAVMDLERRRQDIVVPVTVTAD